MADRDMTAVDEQVRGEDETGEDRGDLPNADGADSQSAASDYETLVLEAREAKKAFVTELEGVRARVMEKNSVSAADLAAVIDAILTATGPAQ